MRYESEILYDLMKRDGLLNPSQDNLPYESELKEKYVDDVKGAYPKLQDYRAEWLNYNKCEYIPADFPTESQTNQTSGTFEKVIPFAYDVAMLKGNTLVNVCSLSSSLTVETKTTNSTAINNTSLLKTSTKYLIMFTSDIAVRISLQEFDASNNFLYNNWHDTQIGINVVLITTNESTKRIKVFNNSTDSIITISDVMILEYQDGMENWDIPYFEGMQSVKMPVLTTTGKNFYAYGDLTINNPLTDRWYYTNGRTSSFGSSCKRTDGGNWFYLEEGVYSYKSINENTRTNIGLTGEGEKSYGSGQKIPSGWYVFRFKTKPESVDYVKISQIQLEKGPNITTYEPHKSNILTVNEEVELRGIGDVQDTLDCLTGEVVQKIGEIVLNGSENWYTGGGTDANSIPFFQLEISNRKSNDVLICDKLIVRKDNDGDRIAQSTTVFGIMGTAGLGAIRIKNGTTSLTEFKQWLSENPITVQYQLTKESIKTVDLRCINEDNVECDFIPIMDTMHYQTSSDTIPPLADLTVCVEATTQNLASFVSLEGVDGNE